MSGALDPGLDRISLTGVRARGFHGVLDHERRDGQEFLVDVVLGISPNVSPGRSDDLRHTVDYGAVAVAIVEILEGPAVNLIETLALRVADSCLAFESVAAVQVTVHKPGAPIPVPFADVAVTVTRAR